MIQIVVAIPMSHTWFWPQTCLTKLFKYKTGLEDKAKVAFFVVDNSWEWSPANKGIINITKFSSNVFWVRNTKNSKGHATALDFIVEKCRTTDLFITKPDYLFAMETDVLVNRDGWLKWYFDKIQKNVNPKRVYACGHWHAEQFINPSATLYNIEILLQAEEDFKKNKDPNMYWGKNFQNSESVIPHDARFMEDVGPFSEKRGWPPGTVLKTQPTGQLRRAGWYEPGQQLHHWAVEKGYNYIVVPCNHEVHSERMIPIGTSYGSDPYRPYIVHLWGGTRALDLLKRRVEDPTVLNNMEHWLKREATYWKSIVPLDIQKQTLELIKEYGWAKFENESEKEKERREKAIKIIQECYEKGGIRFLR